MKTKSKPINIFTLLEHRKPVGSKDEVAAEVSQLLKNIYIARITLEEEILTSPYFYQQLLVWLDLINKKELPIKELLFRGSYTPSELKSKLGAFLLILKAFQKYLANPNEIDKDELYQKWKRFNFNTNRLNAVKEAILCKRIKTEPAFFQKIVKLQAIMNACSSRLVELHAPMAIELAKRKGIKYDEDGVTIEDHEDDLVQAGLLGVFIASQHWEPNKDAAFSTYAWYWIGSEFAKYFNTRDLVLLPRNLISLRNKINRISTQFNLPKCNVSDFKRFLRDSDKRIEAAMTQEGCVSLNEIVSEDFDPEDNGLRFLTDEHDIEQDTKESIEKDQISAILDKKLLPRERHILELRFGLNGNDPCELQQIADEVRMTKEGVRKSLKSSIMKIVPEIVKEFGEDYDEHDAEKVLKMHRQKRTNLYGA